MRTSDALWLLWAFFGPSMFLAGMAYALGVRNDRRAARRERVTSYTGAVPRRQENAVQYGARGRATADQRWAGER